MKEITKKHVLRPLVQFLALATVLSGITNALHAQQVVLRASVISAGGSPAANESHRLQSTIGQAHVGFSSGTDHVVGHGFWHAARSATPVMMNNAPSAPQITEPADGAEIAVGGGSGEPPRDPTTAFTVVWAAASDPDGDPIAYTWQLASANDFTTMLLNEDAGTETTFETTLGSIAGTLDAAGVAPGESVTLWHRAVASDGQLDTEGPAVQITFVRGSLVSIDDHPTEVPDRYELYQNYPNPFNPSTTITYDLPTASHVGLVVYDLFGREVATLVDARKAAGQHEVSFSADHLASGVYLLRIEAGDFRAVRRMLLVK